jgi:ABC-2 type transport system ATP-binding protein
MLAGLLYPTGGTARVLGYVPWERDDGYRRQFALLLGQKNQLWWDLPASESLELNAQIYGIPRAAFDRRVAEMSELLSVRDKLNVSVRELSLGERMKMELIASLLHQPKVLFLDEPTIGLDPRQIQEVRELVKELAGKHTVVLSTHILPEVSQTCQRVVIINKGKVVAIDTPDNLTHRLRGSETMFLQIDGGRVAEAREALERVAGVARVTPAEAGGDGAFEVASAQGHDVRRELARAVVGGGWGLLEFRPMRMSLEEIFLSLTTEEKSEEAAHE